ncbi:hypothetical protein O3P69_009628 [Scylla paramamosain]|uniref:Uncharacterized protein n=1 Tax=Scylla paramamosain TaxID=85552 RepID=A0AAW0SVK9_SCYPA
MTPWARLDGSSEWQSAAGIDLGQRQAGNQRASQPSRLPACYHASKSINQTGNQPGGQLREARGGVFSVAPSQTISTQMNTQRFIPRAQGDPVPLSPCTASARTLHSARFTLAASFCTPHTGRLTVYASHWPPHCIRLTLHASHWPPQRKSAGVTCPREGRSEGRVSGGIQVGRNEGEADRGDPLTRFCVVDLCVEVSWVLPASIVARLLKYVVPQQAPLQVQRVLWSAGRPP